jgi:hypothetical protein
MALMDILDAAQGGALYANAGNASGLAAADARAAMSELCPALAAALRKRAEDPEAFENLLDLIEDGDGDAYLDDPGGLADGEALEDGEAILTDLFGSKEKAQAACADLLPGVEPAALARLAPISAAAVLAALARANKPQQVAASDGGGGGGLLGTIIGAIVEGAVKGAARSLAPKRRRRRYTSYYGSRRRRTTTRKRRPRSPSLNDIFKEILGESLR